MSKKPRRSPAPGVGYDLVTEHLLFDHSRDDDDPVAPKRVPVRMAEAAPELYAALAEVLDRVGALGNPSEFPNMLGITMERGLEIASILAKARGEQP